jgi:hypothetical protein
MQLRSFTVTEKSKIKGGGNVFQLDWKKRVSKSVASQIALMGQKTISFGTAMTTT